MGEEERFEFVQLPRDIRSELQAQTKETAELFQKWCDTFLPSYIAKPLTNIATVQGA